MSTEKLPDTGGQSSAEPLTDELLKHLLESATPDAYLADTALVDRTLAEYAHLLLEDKGLKRSDVIRAAGLNATFGYQVFQGSRKPSRDNVIKLAFGLRCDLTETQRLLRYAGVSELWCKLRRDAIIIYCIDHGYARERCDDELYRLGERTLLAAED